MVYIVTAWETYYPTGKDVIAVRTDIDSAIELARNTLAGQRDNPLGPEVAVIEVGIDNDRTAVVVFEASLRGEVRTRRQKPLTDKQKREIDEDAKRVQRSFKLTIARVRVEKRVIRVEKRVINAAVAWHRTWWRGEHDPDRLHQAVRNLLTLRSNLRKAEKASEADDV